MVHFLWNLEIGGGMFPYLKYWKENITSHIEIIDVNIRLGEVLDSVDQNAGELIFDVELVLVADDENDQGKSIIAWILI